MAEVDAEIGHRPAGALAPHPVRLYNSLTRSVEAFEPHTPGIAGIYTCGPTVYRYAHIGNLRSFLFADVLRRTLLYLGYRVKHVKNITDVGHMRDDTFDEGEDRMELAAEVEGKSPAEIADFYTQAWLEDEAAINILPVDVFPKATEHIPEMIELTQRLLDNGLAYEVGGTVYFDVSGPFPDTASFPANALDAIQAGHRVEVESRQARPGGLRAVEGGRSESAHEVAVAVGHWLPRMAHRVLGDEPAAPRGVLRHPHRRDRSTSSRTTRTRSPSREGALGHRVVGTWMHGEFLTLGDAKMAKSAGNIIRVTDLPEKGFEPLVFRYLALTAHYRSKLDFTEDAMHAAAAGLRRLRRAAQADGGSSGVESAPEVDLGAEPMAGYRQRFADALADDLATPTALAIAHAVGSADDLSPKQRRALLLDFDRVLGLGIDQPPDGDADAPLPPGAQELLDRRAAARDARDFATSDALRDELAALGVEVRDTPDGQTVRQTQSSL